MKCAGWCVAALAAVIGNAQAAGGDKWLLSSYETATKDSAETDSIYGFQAFRNPASEVTVAVQDGAVNLIATKIASDGSEGWSANIGLLHPLTPDWAEHDLTGLTSITFDFQNDNTITDVLSVSFGSNAYSEAIAKAGTVYANDIAGKTALAGGTAWKQGEVLISDFAPPSWWEDIPPTFPTIDSVLKLVKNIQFAPKTAYKSDAGTQNGVKCPGKCVDPSMTSITLKIKNVTLNGVGGPSRISWPIFPGTGCAEDKKAFPLDGFAEGAVNTLGGDWFAFSDYDSTGTSTDPAKGASLVQDSVDTEGAYLVLQAQLRKKVGGIYHKYAGWAAVGTNFGEGRTLDATGWTGIGFQMGDLETNGNLIKKVVLKVKTKGIHDTAVYQTELGMGTLIEAKTAGIQTCITPSHLHQPSYLATSERKPFDPSQIEQISWELKIADDRSSAIDTATASVLLANVTLYGVDKPGVGVKPLQRVKNNAVYHNGALSLSGFSGAARFEVRNLQGKVVASFAAASRVALALPRGTYLLTAIGSHGPATSRFAVLQP